MEIWVIFHLMSSLAFFKGSFSYSAEENFDIVLGWINIYYLGVRHNSLRLNLQSLYFDAILFVVFWRETRFHCKGLLTRWMIKAMLMYLFFSMPLGALFLERLDQHSPSCHLYILPSHILHSRNQLSSQGLWLMHMHVCKHKEIHRLRHSLFCL